MTDDPSNGYEAIAETFMNARSAAGRSVLVSWAEQHIRPAGAILDVGCGSGWPIADALIGAGYSVYGVDAAPRLVEAFRLQCPGAPVLCEPFQTSALFGRTFDAAISTGLIFLLDERAQATLIQRLGAALRPSGHCLFSAPRERGEWPDLLTGRVSISLGEPAYEHLIGIAGLERLYSLIDEGGNHYYAARKPGV